MLEFEYSVAGDIVPVFSEIQALLDTPTTHWGNIFEAELDKLSDVHLTTLTEQPTTTPGDYAIQLDTTEKLELPLALLRQTTSTTRQTPTLIQVIIGQDTNRKCNDCRRTFSALKRLRIHVPPTFYCDFLALWSTPLLWRRHIMPSTGNRYRNRKSWCRCDCSTGHW